MYRKFGLSLFYDRRIPYLEMLKILRRYEEKQLRGEVEKLKNVDIAPEGSVVNLREAAARYDVSGEAFIVFNSERK